MPVRAPDATTPVHGAETRIKVSVARAEYQLRRRLPELVAFVATVVTAAAFAVTVANGVALWISHGLLGLSVASLVVACTSRIDRRNDVRVREVQGHVDGMATRLVGQVYAAHAELLTQMRHVRDEEVAVLRGVAAWVQDMQQRAAQQEDHDDPPGGLWEMTDREMRAYFMGFYDRLG